MLHLSRPVSPHLAEEEGYPRWWLPPWHISIRWKGKGLHDPDTGRARGFGSQFLIPQLKFKPVCSFTQRSLQCFFLMVSFPAPPSQTCPAREKIQSPLSTMRMASQIACHAWEFAGSPYARAQQVVSWWGLSGTYLESDGSLCSSWVCHYIAPISAFISTHALPGSYLCPNSFLLLGHWSFGLETHTAWICFHPNLITSAIILFPD